MINFEDLVYLFSCDVETRGIVRLDLDEAALLYKYAKKSEGHIVEIGRKYGGSALLLASAVNSDRKVYSVDFVVWKELESNLKSAPPEVVERIVLINKESTEAADEWEGPIGLLFIDGDHAYNAVRSDRDSWCKFVAKGGYVAFHDVRDTFLGLEPIVDEMKSNGWEEVDCVDTLVILQKVK